MFGKTPSYLPSQDARSYRILCALLYAGFAFLLIYGAITFIFPYSRYQFDFNNPDANKNTLFEPHLTQFAPVTKGKVSPGETLSVYAHNPHILEGGDATLTLSDSSSSLSLEGTPIAVQRGFAASFLPIAGEQNFPELSIVEYQGNFYQQEKNILFPFVSESAAESWLPKEKIAPLKPEVFATLSLSDELRGFRPGTLLAYADGVFLVTEEGTIRPFGSAEVFLRFGYSFDHVVTASGEDVGIYKRGKIILSAELHPGGTLLYDTDTNTTFLIKEKSLRPLTAEYAQFLVTQNDRISFSSKASEQQNFCILHKQWFQNSYQCHFSLPSLPGIGYDYQISLVAPATEIDIQNFSAGLQASRKNENARATAQSLLNRVLERVGLY